MVVSVVENDKLIVLGTQWGSEGKEHVIQHLLDEGKFDIVAKYQGGLSESPDTGKKLLPSGINHPNVTNVVGNGCVVDVEELINELEAAGIDGSDDRVKISDRAHMILRIHKVLESAFADKDVETSGTGAAYASRTFRNGVRVGDLMSDFGVFQNDYKIINAHLARGLPSGADEAAELAALATIRDSFSEKKLVTDTSFYLHNAILAGKRVLIESNGSALNDVDHGDYPFTNAASTVAGAACNGLGISPTVLRSADVLGVVRAIQTRVGYFNDTGPMPTEQPLSFTAKLNVEGGIRTGWLDLFLLRHATILNGFTALALTDISVLDNLDQIKVGVGYKVDGKELASPPICPDEWARVEVEYATLPGWNADTKNAKSFDEFPQGIKDYIAYIEDYVGVLVKFVSVDKKAEAVISRGIEV